MAPAMENGEDPLARAERERDVALARVREIEGEREADAREALRHFRNMLSVVRSLAQRTADEADTVEEFRAVFDGRLAAFARVQSAAARDARAGVDLGTIIGDELLSFGIGVGDGVDLSGGPVRLLPRAAGLVALAMHELVAELVAEGGAGSARVVWAGSDGLDIDWIQALNGAEIRPLPEWVRQAIAYELKGGLFEDRMDGELRRRIHLPAACRAPAA